MKAKFVLVLIVIVLSFAILGCEVSSDDSGSLPKNATVVRNHGNGWVEFQLEGNTYLFYRGSAGYKGYMALTQIRD